MEAGKRTIREIFNRGQNLEIPFFQRAYVWDEPQWQRFLDDMRSVSTSRKPYFLGSVILKQETTSSNQDAKRTVIDGQQRLTTLNIFLKVLCLKKQSDTEFTDTFKKQRDKSIILLHNHNNEKSFNKILMLEQLDNIEASENDQIIKAYSYFKNHITESDVEKNLDFFNILDYILFVGIDLNYDEDEQQIFDTINSLGVKLTTAELLKNYFFTRNEISNYQEYWGDLFEKDEDSKAYWDREVTTGRVKRTFIDLFFFSFLQIKIQEPKLNVKTDDKIEFSKVEQLFESYKKFISEYLLGDKKSILSEIKEYAQLFQKNFDYGVLENALGSDAGIERINAIIFGLETSTLIPYTLYALRKIENDHDRNQLFEFIETYVMRRMVCNDTTSKNYNQLFTDRLIHNEILSKEQFAEFLEKQADKVNFLPTDDELKKGFDEKILINKQSAGVLYLIESKIRNNNLQSTQLLGMSKYSLEHLMPKKWENHWNKLTNQDDKTKRNRKLLTLGNLAIITQSLNSTIKDADWITKRDGKDEKRKGFKNYCAGLETMTQFLSLDEWNEETIKRRAEFLYHKAKEIWAV